ncbi:NYN domain-containing protein [Fertoebacter nigrum]|uniref:NYN domain-containing protein n=1 Tax=Fertoeibacter niger TaxID=2656921 RepID=A0A8X8H4J4_9RHOB|nr:NYN domain-containing protein [Fertoeibacter niger]NUB46244.1 NYN domain-containing protein [Fertoeibacter niger]
MKDDLRFADVTTSQRRVAVLVDGENLAADHAACILATARGEGRADIIRVYGNAKAIPAWDAQPGFRLIHSGTGKNATDLLLAIDAMELAFGGGIDTVLIASSDRDFAHVAHRLRERGLCVIGMGEEKTPDSFRQACTRFTPLVPKAKLPPAPVTPPIAPTKALPNGSTVFPPQTAISVDEALRRIIAAGSQKGQGVLLSHLEAKAREQGLKPTRLGAATWRDYLLARQPMFAVDGKGSEGRVRFIPTGFATDSRV